MTIITPNSNPNPCGPRKYAKADRSIQPQCLEKWELFADPDLHRDNKAQRDFVEYAVVEGLKINSCNFVFKGCVRSKRARSRQQFIATNSMPKQEHKSDQRPKDKFTFLVLLNSAT